MQTHRRVPLQKIISGGQTGVDLAALDAGRAAGLLVGGWCPPGRHNEAGTIPPDYPLVETPEETSPDATHIPRSLRTEWNVRDSDATLIILPDLPEPDPGTAWTFICAEKYGKPVLVTDPYADDALNHMLAWLTIQPVQTLNIAGPPESSVPGFYNATFILLRKLFNKIKIH